MGQFDLDHAWLHPPTTLPHGRLAHIAKLLMILGTVAGFSRKDSPELVAPLLSQPIVEFCLSIPTWEWVRGGRDRALARQAFADILPTEILRRRTKGNPDRFAQQVIDRFGAQIREHLLGGLLAQNGLLDIEAVQKAMPVGGPVQTPDHLRLQVLAEAESWARAQELRTNG